LSSSGGGGGTLGQPYVGKRKTERGERKRNLSGESGQQGPGDSWTTPLKTGRISVRTKGFGKRGGRTNGLIWRRGAPSSFSGVTKGKGGEGSRGPGLASKSEALGAVGWEGLIQKYLVVFGLPWGDL